MVTTTRRFLLRTSGSLFTGTVLTGCIESSSTGTTAPSNTMRTNNEQTPPPTDESTNHDPEESDIQRCVSLASVDDVPDAYDVQISVELLKSTVTAAQTAHLRVTVTDESSERRQISVGTGQCSLFNRSKGESEPSGLWLHSPNSTKHIDRAGDRWTADRDPDKPRAFLAYGCTYFSTDEPISNEYLVWDDYQVENYMAPGTYRFATAITVGSVTTTENTTKTATESESESEFTFTWGFDLALGLSKR